MDQADLEPMIDDLGTQITQLEAALAPLTSSFTQTASRLPLLEKAKLNVLTTYAVESLLFSYIRLNGQDAKEHPVFEELTRVKQYFGKIKAAEERASGADQPTTKLDKAAAGRFIKHGLSGNDKYDRERAEKLAEEKQRAQAKADEIGRRAAQRQEPAQKQAQEESETSNEEETELKGLEEQESEQKKRKRKSHKAPKSSRETFQALLKGPIPKEDTEKKNKKRKKGKKHAQDG